MGFTKDKQNIVGWMLLVTGAAFILAGVGLILAKVYTALMAVLSAD